MTSEYQEVFQFQNIEGLVVLKVTDRHSVLADKNIL